MENIKHISSITGEISSKIEEISATTNTKSRADLFGIPNNKELKTECTNPDLAKNNAIDGMTIFNCGLKFQNVTHVDTVKQYEV